MVAAVCCYRRGPAARAYRPPRGYSGPRPPHGAYAATISNGLCDHTRAIPRPIANIVRARACHAPHGANARGIWTGTVATFRARPSSP